MNNDLISREDLMRNLQYIYSCDYIDSKSKEGIVSDIIDKIDDAPTIPLPDFKEGYKQAIRDGKTNFSRPKGKWIHREDMDYLDEHKVAHIHFMCEKCGFIHDFIDGHTSQYNFCPNCGADMREEADNDKVD